MQENKTQQSNYEKTLEYVKIHKTDPVTTEKFIHEALEKDNKKTVQISQEPYNPPQKEANYFLNCGMFVIALIFLFMGLFLLKKIFRSKKRG